MILRSLPHAQKDWDIYSKLEDIKNISKPLLFNLTADIDEQRDVADEHPDIVAQLLAVIEVARNDIGDIDTIGENVRFFDSEPKRPDLLKAKK